MSDIINRPPHYTSHPSKVECIEITEHLSFNLGNAFKYLFRRNEKGSRVENVEKSRWYCVRELERDRILAFGFSPRPSFELSVKLGRVVAHEPAHIGRAMTLIVSASFADKVPKGDLQLALIEIETELSQ